MILYLGLFQYYEGDGFDNSRRGKEVINTAILNIGEANRLGYDAKKLLLASYFVNTGKVRTCLRWIAEDLGLSLHGGAGRTLDTLRDMLWELDGDCIITVSGDLDKGTSRFTVEPNMDAPLFCSPGACVLVDNGIIYNVAHDGSNTYRAFARWINEVMSRQGEEG